MVMQFGMFAGQTTTPAITTQVIDAAGEGIGFQFRSPLTDSLDRVYFHVTATAGTPPVYEVRIETVDANGLPTGTLAGGSAAETFTPGGGAESFAITLSTPAALTAGTHYALVIQHSSGSIDGSNNATFNARITQIFDGGLGPVAVVDTGAGWSVQTGASPTMAVQFDSTTNRFVLGCCPCINMGQEGTWGSTTNPDERGMLFTVPVTIDLIGCFFAMRLTSIASDFDIALYGGDSSGDTDLLERQSFDAGFMNTGWSGMAVTWNSIHTLASGTNYRITMEPTTTNAVRLRGGEFPSQALREMVFGLPMQKTTRDGGGSWTNAAAEVVAIKPWFENTVAGGGGGVIHLLAPAA